ncbi:MAG: FHA domain-containing protein [Chloroflexota bacterium]
MEANFSEVPVLIARGGPLKGERWTLKQTVIIGRDSECTIVIPDRQISRVHARLRVSPEGVWLEDLGSKNGTHCNGQKVTEERRLHDGDVLQIALLQQFVFFSSDATLPLDREAAFESEGKLRLDKRSRRVWVGEGEIIPPLSAAQFCLLELLYVNKGRVVPRQEIMETVWEAEDAEGVSDQALDALVRRLRDRLAEFDPDHQYVVTLRGHGLRLENPLV